MWARFRNRIAYLLHRDRIDRELLEEMEFHRRLLEAETPADDRAVTETTRMARVRFGNTAAARDYARDAWIFAWLDRLIADIRHALRGMRKAPGFASVALLSLALGIGANTALFSLVDNLLLRSLPVRDPDSLVWLQVFGFNGFGDGQRNDKALASEFSRRTFDSIREQRQLFSDVIGFRQMNDRPKIALDGAAEPDREVQLISANYFSSLGVSPMLGRTPAASDDHVALISARWWRTRFGASREVLGRSLTVDGRNYAIIGVAPQRFHGFDVDRSADVWILSSVEPLWLVARMQPGVTQAQAEAAAHPVLREEVAPEFQSERMETAGIAVGHGVSFLRRQYEGALLALTGLVTLVLLTTCTNVGNLMMLRNAARRRELSVRAALGAGRSRLVAQSLVESLILAVIGGVAGLFLANWGVSIIVSMLPMPSPPDGLLFYADARVIGFAAAVAALSVILYGLAPAWRAADFELSDALRTWSGSSQTKRTRRMGRVLVASQVALSVLLLVGAGLFIRTLQNLGKLDVGFRSDQLLQVSVDTKYAGYKEGTGVLAVRNTLFERIGAIPGVRSVTSTRSHLMQGSSTSIALPIRGLVRGTKFWDAVEVGPEFFETMGIGVVRGRVFSAADFALDPADTGEMRERQSGPRTESEVFQFVRRMGPYVVNEAFARLFEPGADPLATTSPIVGIVKDVKVFDVKDKVGPVMFLPSRRPDSIRAVQVRGAGETRALMAAIREAVLNVNPLLYQNIATLDDGISRNVAKERMVAAISGFFGALGLLLASVAIFGVASNAIAYRTKELGIRRALGAGGWRVIREALGGTLAVVSAGLGAGALAAFVLVRLTASAVTDLLYGLSATDAANLATAVAVMTIVGLTACALPAWRATRIDPLAVIKEE